MLNLKSPYDLVEMNEGPPRIAYLIQRNVRANVWVYACGSGERFPTCYESHGAAEEAQEAWGIVCPDWTTRIVEETE